MTTVARQALLGGRLAIWGWAAALLALPVALASAQPAAAAIAVASAERAAPSAAALDQLPQQWRDDRGAPLALATLAGRRVFLTMAYARCHRLCPATIGGLRQLQKQLEQRGEAADFVVVGYDPDSDDPAAWHQYRIGRHLDSERWHFLTGSRSAVEQLARQLGFEFWNYDGHVMHDTRVVVFDAHGQLTGALGNDSRNWPAEL